jgi:hypothetical protein
LLLHPAIAESGFAALGAATSCLVATDDLPAPSVMCPALLQRFAEVSDGRCDHGRVHPVAVVLALCAAAVVAGMGSFTAIAGWAADVPTELLAQLYSQCCEPPSKATIWQVVTGADAAAVDAAIGAWLAEQATARHSGGVARSFDGSGGVLVLVYQAAEDGFAADVVFGGVGDGWWVGLDAGWALGT